MTRKTLIGLLLACLLVICSLGGLYVSAISQQVAIKTMLEMQTQNLNSVNARLAKTEGVTQTLVSTHFFDKIDSMAIDTSKHEQKLANLEQSVDLLKKDLRINLSSASSIDKRYILFLSYLIKVEQDLGGGIVLEDDIKTLLKLSDFDSNLKEFVLQISDKTSVPTAGELINEYKKFVRRISSATYEKQGKYIRSFFARHFYLTKSGLNLDYINTLFEQKNFSLALKEVKILRSKIDDSDYIDSYIEKLENYVIFYKTISDIHSYIFRRFSY